MAFDHQLLLPRSFQWVPGGPVQPSAVRTWMGPVEPYWGSFRPVWPSGPVGPVSPFISNYRKTPQQHHYRRKYNSVSPVT